MGKWMGWDGITGWVPRKNGKLWFLKTYDPSTPVPRSLPSLISVSMAQVAVSVTNNRISTQHFSLWVLFLVSMLQRRSEYRTTKRSLFSLKERMGHICVGGGGGWGLFGLTALCFRPPASRSR